MFQLKPCRSALFLQMNLMTSSNTITFIKIIPSQLELTNWQINWNESEWWLYPVKAGLQLYISFFFCQFGTKFPNQQGLNVFQGINVTLFFLPAPTSSLWRRSASPRPAAPPPKPPSVSPPPSASETPPSWTRPTTSLLSCPPPASQSCSPSRWETTRATVVSGILRCHRPRATASTTRPWAEPMGWVSRSTYNIRKDYSEGYFGQIISTGNYFP